MFVEHDPGGVLEHVARWAEQREPVRAMLLTGTRADPRAPVDTLSDYDVVLTVKDIHPFFAGRSWLGGFGRVLVAYWETRSTPSPTTASSRRATSCSTRTALRSTSGSGRSP